MNNNQFNRIMGKEIDFNSKTNPYVHVSFKQCLNCIHNKENLEIGSVIMLVDIPPGCEYKKEVRDWLNVLRETSRASDAEKGCPYGKEVKQ